MTHPESKNFGIILLAAGASTRLGKPKQLLQYNGRSLLEYNVQIASDSLANEIVVVLGANAEAIKEKSELYKAAHIIVNEEWKEGMASSIRHGIKALLKIDPHTEGVILMVCDQPYVTSTLLNNLFFAHTSSGRSIITCSYENTFGPPTFFHRKLFPELLELKGETGARKIVSFHVNDSGSIPFPQGKIDIDTEEDYENLNRSLKSDS